MYRILIPHIILASSALVLLCSSALSLGADSSSPSDRSIWSNPILREVPAVFPAQGISEPGVRALFFESVPYRGKPTRVFAWYGVPKTGGPKFPAMVLVHGGGGTAFARWVRLWNDRGYAAIAMDTYGAVPSKSGSEPHEWHGPIGAMDTFEQVDEPATDQWPYHGVAAVMRARSLIGSFPEIDSRRVGITGISWGGYLTSMVAGIDDRFACAAPVYGCGYFFHDSGGFYDKLKSMGERGKKWATLWDASTLLPNARLPMLWLNGTTDHWFPLPAWQSSYRAAPGTRSLALRNSWPHGQFTGEEAPEIGRFMDSILANGNPLPRIVEQKSEKENLVVRWESAKPIIEVEFNYTSNSGILEKRKWNSIYLPVDPQKKYISAPIPPDATLYYCNIADADGMIASTDHMEHTPAPGIAPGTTTPPTQGNIFLNEDFENRGVGISPRGVQGSDHAKGAGIQITDETAATGTRSLRFSDAPGLAYDHFPIREFYLGQNQMTQGQVTLSFDFRNNKAKPGHFVVEMRDMHKTPHQRGPRLEFTANGKLIAGDKEVATLAPDTWTRIDVNMTLDGKGGKTYQLKVTDPNGTSQSFDLPCSAEFSIVSWIAFMMPGNASGVVYVDNLFFACK